MSTLSSDKVVSFTVKPRGKPIKHLPDETYAKPSDTCQDIYDRIAAKARFDVNRLRITKASDGSLIPNDRKVTIESTGLYEASTIHVKDLGPQIGWQTTFLIEYAGPILIHPLVFLLRTFLYKNPNAPLAFPTATNSQLITLSLIVLHFVKRELETLYVHRFSAATMPLLNVFKNSFHYWILSGLNMALFTYSPSFPGCSAAKDPDSPLILPLALLLFAVGETGNFAAHLSLRALRSKGGSERGIPTGWAYKVPVTCPNYFFEVIAWLGILLANRSWSTVLFLGVAIAQMAPWAIKKEKRYRADFGSKYRRKRFSMLPGIV